MATPPTAIRKLDEDVVNRIAAGEVVQRPASALKEMLENSLDAGATQITITAKDGGLKVLQIQDNGSGIRHDDLGILCHRHTTSKLQAFEDLATMSTLGFRGEALCSISHVAHLTVTTMTRGSPHGWRVSYRDGEMEAPPQPCAAVPGTTITVEDLFFNMPARKKALKSPTEEYSRVLDVVSRYALYKTGVGFSCKKQGETRSDVHALATAGRLDTIRAVYGPAVAKGVVPLSLKFGPAISDDTSLDAEPALELQGFITGPQHAGGSGGGRRGGMWVFFINGRAVDVPMLRRTLDLLYTSLLPKGGKPFVFLDMKLPPRHVEVNLHPTKSEVGFLNQEQIIDKIREAVEEKLLSAEASRTFATSQLSQASLRSTPAAPTPKGPASGASQATDTAAAPSGSGRGAGSGSGAAYRPDKLVRVDHKAGSLDAFLNPARAAALAGAAPRRKRSAPGPDPLDITAPLDPNDPDPLFDAAPPATDPAAAAGPLPRLTSTARPTTELTSIQELWAEVEAKAHPGLADILRCHTFVGMADETMALLQHGTRLYLADLTAITRALFYQQLLRRWGAITPVEVAPPLAVGDLMALALDIQEAKGLWQPGVDGTKEEITGLVGDLLVEYSEMLAEYLGLRVTPEGRLAALPGLLGGYQPDAARLPDLLLALARDVDWTDEAACFRGLAQAVAEFYALHPRPAPEPTDDPPSPAGPLATPPSSSPRSASAPMDVDREAGPLPASAHEQGNVDTGGREAEGDRAGAPGASTSGQDLDRDLDMEDAADLGKEGGAGGAGAAGGGGTGGEGPSGKEGDGKQAGGGGGKAAEEDRAAAEKLRLWTIQHVLLPAVKASVVPPRQWATDGTLLQLASLERLYRIFERC